MVFLLLGPSPGLKDDFFGTTVLFLLHISLGFAALADHFYNRVTWCWNASQGFKSEIQN
jgi:hypothetical protein